MEPYNDGRPLSGYHIDPLDELRDSLLLEDDTNDALDRHPSQVNVDVLTTRNHVKTGREITESMPFDWHLFYTKNNTVKDPLGHKKEFKGWIKTFIEEDTEELGLLKKSWLKSNLSTNGKDPKDLSKVSHLIEGAWEKAMTYVRSERVGYPQPPCIRVWTAVVKGATGEKVPWEDIQWEEVPCESKDWNEKVGGTIRSVKLKLWKELAEQDEETKTAVATHGNANIPKRLNIFPVAKQPPQPPGVEWAMEKAQEPQPLAAEEHVDESVDTRVEEAKDNLIMALMEKLDDSSHKKYYLQKMITERVQKEVDGIQNFWTRKNNVTPTARKRFTKRKHKRSTSSDKRRLFHKPKRSGIFRAKKARKKPRLDNEADDEEDEDDGCGRGNNDENDSGYDPDLDDDQEKPKGSFTESSDDSENDECSLGKGNDSAGGVAVSCKLLCTGVISRQPRTEMTQETQVSFNLFRNEYFKVSANAVDPKEYWYTKEECKVFKKNAIQQANKAFFDPTYRHVVENTYQFCCNISASDGMITRDGSVLSLEDECALLKCTGASMHCWGLDRWVLPMWSEDVKARRQSMLQKILDIRAQVATCATPNNSMMEDIRSGLEPLSRPGRLMAREIGRAREITLKNPSPPKTIVAAKARVPVTTDFIANNDEDDSQEKPILGAKPLVPKTRGNMTMTRERDDQTVSTALVTVSTLSTFTDGIDFGQGEISFHTKEKLNGQDSSVGFFAQEPESFECDNEDDDETGSINEGIRSLDCNDSVERLREDTSTLIDRPAPWEELA